MFFILQYEVTNEHRNYNYSKLFSPSLLINDYGNWIIGLLQERKDDAIDSDSMLSATEEESPPKRRALSPKSFYHKRTPTITPSASTSKVSTRDIVSKNNPTSLQIKPIEKSKRNEPVAVHIPLRLQYTNQYCRTNWKPSDSLSSCCRSSRKRTLKFQRFFFSVFTETLCVQD